MTPAILNTWKPTIVSCLEALGIHVCALSKVVFKGPPPIFTREGQASISFRAHFETKVARVPSSLLGGPQATKGVGSHRSRTRSRGFCSRTPNCHGAAGNSIKVSVSWLTGTEKHIESYPGGLGVSLVKHLKGRLSFAITRWVFLSKKGRGPTFRRISTPTFGDDLFVGLFIPSNQIGRFPFQRVSANRKPQFKVITSWGHEQGGKKSLPVRRDRGLRRLRLRLREPPSASRRRSAKSTPWVLMWCPARLPVIKDPPAEKLDPLLRGEIRRLALNTKRI